ncbi:zinc finger protein 236-like [Xyrauchen texanus]|uniref:zinc finger protein 236-like n=1 Tax=Xyrauchen texanus TaxID=154827 RepID=UPI002241EA45|nr:zinc finger protein 236-like [Xyrauchen texanus]
MLGLQETRSDGSPATKTYNCVACSSTFNSLASLLVHQASHANEMSGQPESTLPTCVSCGSLFSSKDLLDKHHCMELPTPASSELYICDCGDIFSGLTDLEKHKKLHEPEAQVSSNLDRIPAELSTECLEDIQPEVKTDSSDPVLSHVFPSLSPSNSNEEPLMQSDSPLSKQEIKDIVSTTDMALPVESNISNQQEQNLPFGSPSNHCVIEEQEQFLEKDSDTVKSISMLNHSVDDCEKSPESCKESTAFNKKSILKMLASAYMSHKQPDQMKPEQTKRNLPPRKVAPRAPVQAVPTITLPKPLQKPPETKNNENMSCSSGTVLNIKTGKMLSKKGKIISVTQTLCPVVVLDTRQKLFSRDKLEGRHQCRLCRKVFQDLDSLIMHHALHKKERVKFCLRCKQFVITVISVPNNHICSGTFAGNHQCSPHVGKMSLTLNSPSTEQAQKLFYCSLCKRSYSCMRNLKRHNCPCRGTLISSATLGNQGNVKLHGFKEQYTTVLQEPKIKQMSTQQVNVGVGTEPIKFEEQNTEFPIGKKNQTALKMQSPSLKTGGELNSPEPSEYIFAGVSNSTLTISTKTENIFEIKADEKDTFGEKQWTMPLDDTEIDVLTEVDHEEDEDNLADKAKEDCDEDEDVVTVKPHEDKEIKSVLASSGFQVHMTEKGVRRFVCIGCQRSYSRCFTLKQHLKICGAIKLKQLNYFKNTSSSVPGPIKSFPCPQCGRFFSRKDNMNSHQKKCQAGNTNSPVGTRIVESETQAAQENVFVLSPSSESQTVRQEGSANSGRNWGIMSLPSVLPRRVTCECGASFTCPRLLFEHLQVHAQESYICPHCGENVQSWMDFEAHQQLHLQSQSQASVQKGSPRHSFSQVAQSSAPTLPAQSHAPTLPAQSPTLTWLAQSPAPTWPAQSPAPTWPAQSPAPTWPAQSPAPTWPAQSPAPTPPQQSSGFQAPELSVQGQPPALRTQQHLNQTRPLETLVCLRCKKTFSSRKSLLRHLRLNCRGDASGQRKHSCSHCGMTFQNPLTLKVHVQSNTCKPTFKPIRCPVCVHWFSSLDGLKRHLLSHSKQQGLKCQICDHYCPSPQALEEHKRSVHTINRITSVNEKQEPLCEAGSQSSTSAAFQCHICLRNYPKLQSLKDHVRKVHRPKDKKQSNLKTVDQVRPGQFQCQICLRNYPSLVSLKNHRRRVHRILGGVFQSSRGTEQNHTPNQFQCQICARSYPDLMSLKNHRRRVHRILGGLELNAVQHNPYKCQICQRSYPDVVSLKNHRRRVHRILGPVPETTTMVDTKDPLQQKLSNPFL